MRITESALRQIIHEELTLLSEVVKNTHGYSVRSVNDVMWTPDKRRIPADRNPFVGSSPAFDSWYNDGQMTRRWKKDFEQPSGDVKTLFGANDIYFNDGDHVIVPTLDKIDGVYTLPGVVMNIHHKDPEALGVPGAPRGATIPLVDVRWQLAGTNRTTWLRDVGLAFLIKLGGARMFDPVAAASSAMKYHNKGREERDEKDSRAADRAARRAAREEDSPSPARREPEPPSSSPARAIRRVGGVAAPPPERKPQKMSDEEIRQMLGLRKR